MACAEVLNLGPERTKQGPRETTRDEGVCADALACDLMFRAIVLTPKTGIEAVWRLATEPKIAKTSAASVCCVALTSLSFHLSFI